MSPLVQALTEEQEVATDLRPDNSLNELGAAVERNFVHLRFVRTGTTVGLRLDRAASSLDALSSGTGRVTLCGDLVIDYEKVRVTAHLDLSSLSGRGSVKHLGTVDPWSATS